MDKEFAELTQWMEALSTYETILPERMPDIELYMDQVITFLTRQLNVFSRDELEKSITPSMINNYAKDGIIPRPVHKKYNRTHLSALLMLFSFKQVLPIGDIATFIDRNDPDHIFHQYETFRAIQDSAISQTSGRITEMLRHINETKDEEGLKDLAMQLVTEANILSSVAKKILHILEKDEEPEKRTKDK